MFLNKMNHLFLMDEFKTREIILEHVCVLNRALRRDVAKFCASPLERFLS